MRRATSYCFLQDPCNSLIRNLFHDLVQVECGFEVAKIQFEGTSRFRRRRVLRRVNRFDTYLHNIIMYSRSLFWQKREFSYEGEFDGCHELKLKVMAFVEKKFMKLHRSDAFVNLYIIDMEEIMSGKMLLVQSENDVLEAIIIQWLWSYRMKTYGPASQRTP